jgi:dTDP-4-dehydrorhamnose 3,5-epimerase
VSPIVPLRPSGLLLIEPRRFQDARGTFSESYRAEWLAEAGCDAAFVQDNTSVSLKSGTIRGFHFQAPPHAHDKLIRVTRGAILDVVVDIRRASETYGQVFSIELSAGNWLQLFVPKGFAHAFCTLQDDTQVVYKLSDYYAPEAERGILWCDPSLGVEWPIAADRAIVSEKDANLPRFGDFVSPFDA